MKNLKENLVSIKEVHSCANHLQCTYGTHKYFITLKMNSSIVKIVSGLINLLKTCILFQKMMNALKDMPYLQLYYSLSHAFKNINLVTTYECVFIGGCHQGFFNLHTIMWTLTFILSSYLVSACMSIVLPLTVVEYLH